MLTVRTRLFYARPKELLELLEKEPSLKAVAAEFAKKPKRGKRAGKASADGQEPTAEAPTSEEPTTKETA